MPYDGLAGRSILLVDDEEVFLSSVVEGLEAQFPGLRLFTAGEGEAALRVFEEHVVDLVLTDISMPIMDGLEFVAAMISRDIDVPVITVTAFGTRALDRIASDHGVLAVLDKPIDFAALAGLCRETLSSHEPGVTPGVTLAGLLFLLEVDGRHCVVRTLSEEGPGRILIDGGRVVGCTLADDAGQSALCRLLSCRDLRLELAPAEEEGRSAEPLSVRDALEEQAPSGRQSPRIERRAPETRPSSLISDDSSTTRSRDSDRAPEERTMSNTEQAISQAMNIQGCIAAALVDYESGMCLGSRGQGFPIEVAAAGNTEVLRSKMRVMGDLGIEGRISDILITLDTQYHLIMPLRKGTLFLYVAIDRKTGNLAMARHKLTSIEQALVV